MEITIAGHKITLYERVTLNLKFDAVASTFSMLTYFDPENEVHQKIFLPGACHACTIEHDGVRLLTGYALSVQFVDSGDPAMNLVQIGGYSKTGVLEDSPVVYQPLQIDNRSLKNIAETVCEHYDIEVVVDEEVAEDAETVFNTAQPEADESVRSFLDKMCSHLNIVLSNNANGNLLLTRAKAGKKLTKKATAVKTSPTAFDSSLEGAPEDNEFFTTTQSSDRPVLYHFERGTTYTQMALNFDGQRIHSDIMVLGQYDGQSNDNTPDLLYNPYFLGSEFLENYRLFTQQAYQQSASTLRGRRPRTVIQRQQTDSSLNAAPKTARMVLAEELKAITLGVSTDRWVLDGNMITPNQIISVINPRLYLYKKTEWFISEVILNGKGAEMQVADLHCVPVDAFTNEEPQNIFR